MTIRRVRRRPFDFTTLLLICTRASKIEARVTARLTVPPHTHAPIYTRLRPAPLHRLQREHMHTVPKLTRDTCTQMYTKPVPHGLEGGACILGRSGSNLAQSRDRILVHGTPSPEQPPLAAKPPTTSTQHAVSCGVLNAREGSLLPGK